MKTEYHISPDRTMARLYPGFTRFFVCYCTRPFEGRDSNLRKSHSKSLRDGIFAVPLGFLRWKPRKNASNFEGVCTVTFVFSTAVKSTQYFYIYIKYIEPRGNDVPQHNFRLFFTPVLGYDKG